MLPKLRCRMLVLVGEDQAVDGHAAVLACGADHIGRDTEGFGIGRAFVLRQRGLRDTQHQRSEEHTSELQSLMRISYAVFCLKKKKQKHITRPTIILPQKTANHRSTILSTT